MRRDVGGSVAVADRVGVIAPIGILAVAILALMAPLAFAAGDVVLQEYEIPFAESLSLGKFAARLLDIADILVPHDHGRAHGRFTVKLHISSADPSHFHLQQSTVGGDLRHRKFADLSRLRCDSYRGEHALHSLFLSSGI